MTNQTKNVVKTVGNKRYRSNVTVVLTPEQAELLSQISFKKGMSKSTVLRTLVVDFIDKELNKNTATKQKTIQNS